MSKLEHRRKMKGKLSLIDESALTVKSSLLSKNLDDLLKKLHVIQENICIGAFAPIEKEPHWFLELSGDLQKLTAYPAFDSNTKQMVFKKAVMSDLIVKNDFGASILCPKDDALSVIPGVILVPALSFAENGERLGRGKGFYDKYLTNYQGIKIGICFSEQLEARLPTEEHDEKVDYIVTEEKIINCKLA